jgi:hypothetical protein
VRNKEKQAKIKSIGWIFASINVKNNILTVRLVIIGIALKKLLANT